MKVELLTTRSVVHLAIRKPAVQELALQKARIHKLAVQKISAQKLSLQCVGTQDGGDDSEFNEDNVDNNKSKEKNVKRDTNLNLGSNLSCEFINIMLSKLNELKTETNWGSKLEVAEDISSLIDNNIKILKEINKKGYINDTNLYKYPIIGEIIQNIVKDNKDINHGSGNRLLIGNKEFSYATSKELYKWSYNIANLKMYLMGETVLKELVNDMSSDEYKIELELSEASNQNRRKDLMLDYINLNKSLLNNLDPSIRKLFSKRGISIIQNIYTGFDTEFVNINSIENKLLSVQLAVATKTLLKLPLKKEFEFGVFNIDSNKFHKSTQKIEEGGWTINKGLIKCILNNSVNYLRELKYSNYDKVFETLVRGLRLMGIKEVIKDDSVYFIFDSGFNNIKEYYKETSKVNFKDLVNISRNLSKEDLEKELNTLYDLLRKVYENRSELEISDLENKTDYLEYKVDELELFKEGLDNLKRVSVDTSDKDLLYSGLDNRKFVRSYNQSISKERINITKKINNYFIGHLTSADLSMMNDFDEIKDKLDIVNKSFVTLNRSLLIDGVNVSIRDTMLLAPGGKKSLDSIGRMYNLPKIEIPMYYKDKMDRLLKDNPVLFKDYAMQDAVIALIHGGFMEVFSNQIGGVGIPLTLSGLSSNYIKHFWDKVNYEGYQFSHEYLLTNVSKTNTPKGFSVVKDVGLMNNYFIASYRGGRNESFMYGKDFGDCVWYDYDLVSAYTTAMAGLGTPDYRNGRMISLDDFNKLGWKNQVYSYTVLKVKFKFPDNVKYPSIPCNIDESTTVYPMEGDAIINSLEYIVAEKQGCQLIVSEIVHIPFKKDDALNVEKPFRDCIAELQGNRSKYDKGTINNLLYKEIGNSLYGLTVRGINNKLKYDIRSDSMKRMEGNELSNPLIASWITSFIRSVVSESLHSIHLLNGRVVSVTTDGFITDVKDLERNILELKGRSKSMIGEYKELRKDLLNDDTSLEVKKYGKGIISWCTRGQVGDESGIMAMTGFQKGSMNVSEVRDYVSGIMDTNEKAFNFLKMQLRGAKEIYMKGGQVTSVYSDQMYRVMYDNKRIIIDDINSNLLDSRPLNNVDEGMLVRYISNLPKTYLYSRNIQSVSAKYKSKDELIIRNFIKALLNNNLNLEKDSFNNYREIVDYIKDFKPEYNISENYISQLKRRGNFVKVPRNEFGELFVDYVKIRFPNFDSDGLFT